MSSLSEIVGQKHTSQDNRSETTSFVTQESERAPLAAKVSTKARGDKQDDSRPTDLLIEGLVDRLPKPNGLWPLAEREKWLRTAASVFDLIYKIPDEERGEICITAKTEGAERLDVEPKKS